MTKSYREITRSVSSSLAKLRADTPDVLKAFSALAEAQASLLQPRAPDPAALTTGRP
jgi:hypothetical protein